ncbi:hypothetical protein AB3X96_35405 [Paraburkholderia sp. BR13439]
MANFATLNGQKFRSAFAKPPCSGSGGGNARRKPYEKLKQITFDTW